ncbi:class I SAM-dependent methyltransferase [Pseudodesulfovibrio portus]|uniref:D-mycarose 3-C-methyltransferase n=1 Tax=Pseudodesulfovibrio portus TaxID=231439 RepID=A0ABM8ANJ7_9BACT|nr:methyltransferase domain-containing protein [Pseudodesulfovibrio portus]BDQ32987.1 D-mycarose 3-C-methyltransferase [Pseudodesulfovibrio portus]
MTLCCLCNSPRLETLVKVDGQPLGNRFLQAADADEYTHVKHAAVCLDCGLVQLVDPIPAEEMMPVFDWITYNEPEPHLDRTAEVLFGLPGIGPESVVGGVSFKDDSTIARLERMGVENTWRIDPEAHLGVDRPGVGVETVQARLPECLDTGLARFRQRADILISRHIMEHLHDLRGYMRGLRAMVRPGGYLFLEAPCCDDQFRLKDFAPLWEEHLQYYTPAIFKGVFAAFGFELVHYERVSYPLEDSLVGVGRLVGEEQPFVIDADELAVEIERARGYGRGFDEMRAWWREYLAAFTKEQGKVAVFGAGHLGCTFVNLLGLKEHISFFVDDNPDKAGLFMPGSRLPILKSAALIEEDVKLALMCFNPAVEPKVIANNQPFLDRGGRFASIFPKSAIALGPERSVS